MPIVSDYTALLSGTSWGSQPLGRPAFVTFSIEAAAQPHLSSAYSAEFVASFQPLNAVEQGLARQAMQMWAEASGLVVFEVPAGQGDIQFAKYDFQYAPNETLRQSGGFATFPSNRFNAFGYFENAYSGDVFVRAPKSEHAYVYLHEVGHALGLKHPFDGDTVLDPLLDNTGNTVMAYKSGGGPAVKLGPVDVEAIQAIYGPPSADGTQVAAWSWDAANFILSQAGAAGDDTILGVAVRDMIAGGAGNDLVGAAGGDDSLLGDAGDDSLFGSFGADTLSGGDGNDRLDGGDGFNVVRAGAGDDMITLGGPGIADGGSGMDRLTFGVFGLTPVRLDLDALMQAGGVVDVESFFVQGGAAGDTLIGSAFGESLQGNAGDDYITPGPGADTVFGGPGVDTVDLSTETAGLRMTIGTSRHLGSGFEFIGSDVEVVVATSFADTLGGDSNNNQLFGRGGDDSIAGAAGDNYLRGDEGNDTVLGGAAFDDINGNMGNDSAAGGEGADWIVGGKDDDRLFGDGGADLVYGNLGADTLDGGAGADIVRGGQADDVLAGGDGDDFLAGDRGSDTVSGGQGADVFHSAVGAGLDRITDFSVAQGDRIALPTGTTYVVRQVGADTVVDLGGDDRMVLVGVSMSALGMGAISFI